MPGSGNLPPDFDRGRVTNVHQGDCRLAAHPGETLSTVLGSCISACIRDCVAGVGGMNHFLLAEQSGASRDRFGASARYGAFAMEDLINKVLARGTGDRTNLEIKLFGGGNISEVLTDVGAINARFVREFMSREGYEITSEDLGGPYARRLMFKPDTGRAFVKRLDSLTGQSVVREELEIAGRPATQPEADDVELF